MLVVDSGKGTLYPLTSRIFVFGKSAGHRLEPASQDQTKSPSFAEAFCLVRLNRIYLNFLSGLLMVAYYQY